ncbi:unnamed protein product [Strongylus vulgaris]|uniref:Nematode cuticle collagen N-terminal domain-containing protein n=1 Tax=Strongylus vulgaris TaxID=40348 RepID=A0A3P7J090_STRVU|nr:unnamed protein product [Strongylus vulgaris]
MNSKLPPAAYSTHQSKHKIQKFPEATKEKQVTEKYGTLDGGMAVPINGQNQLARTFPVPRRQELGGDEEGLDLEENVACKPCCVPGPRGQPGRNGKNGFPGAPGTNGLAGLPGKLKPCEQMAVQICRECPQGQNGHIGSPGQPGDRGQRGNPGRKGMKGLPGTSGRRGSLPVAEEPIPGEPGLPGVSKILHFQFLWQNDSLISISNC